MAYTAQQKSLVSARMREITKAKKILEEPVVNTPQELPIEPELPIIEPELPITESEKESEREPETIPDIVPEVVLEEVPEEVPEIINTIEVPTEPEKKSFPKKKVKKEDNNES